MKNIIIFKVVFVLIFFPYILLSKDLLNEFDVNNFLELEKYNQNVQDMIAESQSIFHNELNFENDILENQENFSNLLEIFENNGLDSNLLSMFNSDNNSTIYLNQAPEIDGIIVPESIQDYNKLFDIMKEAINNLKTNRSLTSEESDILKIKAFLLFLYLAKIEFSTFKTLYEYRKTGKIEIEPNSIVIIDYETFCLRAGAPAPSTFIEPMILEKNKASWQSKIIKAMKKKNYDKKKIQEFLWDIQNQKSFNYFSKDEQKLIETELPSYNLSKSQKLIEVTLSKIGLDPRLSSSLARSVEIKDSKYNNKENYYKILETPSTNELPKNMPKFAEIEKGLITRVESTNRHENATIIYVNKNDYKKSIEQSDIIAKPGRKVQPIGFLEPTSEKKLKTESLKRLTLLLNTLDYFGLLNNKDKETIEYLNKIDFNVNLEKAEDLIFSFLPDPIKIVDNSLKCFSGIINNINNCVDVILEIPIAKHASKINKIIKLRDKSQRFMDFSDVFGLKEYILNPKI